MNVLMFCGSLERESSNKKLLSLMRKIFSKSTDADVELVDLKALNIPLYNPDDIDYFGIPDGVLSLNQKILFSNAIIISTPEYNGSMSGVLKNTIDWLAKARPMGLFRKQILLVGSSLDSSGGIKGVIHSKMAIEALENFIYPKIFTLPFASRAFDHKGDLVDQTLHEKLQAIITSFTVYCQKRDVTLRV